MFADRLSLELHQIRRLRELLARLLPGNAFYRTKFAQVQLHDIQAPGDLVRLPFTTKQDLWLDQQQQPPYGTALTYSQSAYVRMHQTSGTTTGQPLRWLDTAASWQWLLGCWDQIFNWIGLRPDDRLFFPFSFGPFLGFWTAFEAAVRAGRCVLPGGGMTSTGRLKFLLEHQATVLCCTPTYALHLAEMARRDGIDLAASAVRMLIVAGEPGGSIPTTRQRIESAWGARVIDHSGMTEVGPVAVEHWDAPGSLQVLESEYIVEVVEPMHGQDAHGLGELVLTNLGRTGSPLIRYRTGDLVRLERSKTSIYQCLTGGILGRVDDMIHVRGNNVYPSAIEAVVRRFPDIAEYRIVLRQTGALADLRIELEPMPGSDGAILIDHVGRTLRDELLFRADVVTVPPGSLPRYELKARRLVREG